MAHGGLRIEDSVGGASRVQKNCERERFLLFPPLLTRGKTSYSHWEKTRCIAGKEKTLSDILFPPLLRYLPWVVRPGIVQYDISSPDNIVFHDQAR